MLSRNDTEGGALSEVGVETGLLNVWVCFVLTLKCENISYYLF